MICFRLHSTLQFSFPRAMYYKIIIPLIAIAFVLTTTSF